MNIFNTHMSEACNNLIDIIAISIASQNLLQVTLKSYLLLFWYSYSTKWLQHVCTVDVIQCRASLSQQTYVQMK